MTKRILCFLLAVVMMLGILTAGALSAAAEPEEETTQTEETTAETTEPEATEAEETQPEVTEPESTEPEPTEPEPTETEVTEPEPTEPEPTEPEPTEPEPTEPEPTEPEGYSASDACIEALKQEEGFSKKPYWDYAQWTVGYGTRCPSDMLDHYLTYGITEKEAEVLLRNHLQSVYRDLNKFVEKNGLTPTQNQFDAMIMISYNCGTAWAFDEEGLLYQAIATGADDNEIIRAFARWCRAGGQVQTFLLRRRLCEANMYLNAVYSKTPPENYCYVIFDPNGGTVSPASQGYDSNLTAKILADVSYSGYTFVGWFTQPEGGEQVTVLDESTKSATLYAHWVDAEGNAPEKDEQVVNVTVKVTADDVNLRKGPGTNYTIIGSANTGDQFTITAVATGSGYTWGQYDGGWICLKYTNYDTVIQEGGSSEDEPTEPTEPEEEEKPTTVTGTVKANGGLCVRSGPGTGYTALRYLANGSKVEITEQKTVGSMVWGKISDGWISMKYVILDEVDEPTDPEPSEPKPTEPEPTEPKPTEPKPTEPKPTEPEPTEPKPTEPEPTEPEPTEPETTVLKGTIKADGGLRVRSGPGIGYSIVKYLYTGTKVEITETKTVGSTKWGKVSGGWISMDYVVLDATVQQPVKTQTGTVKADGYLRVRSGPGTSYAVCGYLYTGNKVTITETKTVGATVWGKISNGWISLDYVIMDSGSTGSTGSSGTTGNTGSTGSTGSTTPAKVIKTINTDCLRIRSKAGTDNAIVGYLYYGAKVEILETTTVGGTTWGRISQGWICMDYVK